jgi:hypothetical protein
MGRAAFSASHARTQARTHRQRSHAVGAGLWKAGAAMSPARSLTCWVAFTEPSVFFFDIFSCIRRCARLDAQKMSATLKSQPLNAHSTVQQRASLR